MIITIIFLGMVLLGIIILKQDNTYYNDHLEFFGMINSIFGSVGLIIAILVIIISHIMAPRNIQKNKIEYDGLCKRYEIVKSEYEDVSKSDVIADITAWNMEVYNTKYWADNPWTNWFNPKEIADNLNYISLEFRKGDNNDTGDWYTRIFIQDYSKL